MFEALFIDIVAGLLRRELKVESLIASAVCSGIAVGL